MEREFKAQPNQNIMVEILNGLEHISKQLVDLALAQEVGPVEYQEHAAHLKLQRSLRSDEDEKK